MINIFFFYVKTGHYVYIETSAPRRPNDTARILSPRYTDRSDMCMQFYYHMLGSGVGTLNVYAKVHLSKKRFWNFLLIRSLYFINLYMYNDLQISCQYWVVAMITHESESSPNWIDLTHMIMAHFSCGKQFFWFLVGFQYHRLGQTWGIPCLPSQEIKATPGLKDKWVFLRPPPLEAIRSAFFLSSHRILRIFQYCRFIIKPLSTLFRNSPVFHLTERT